MPETIKTFLLPQLSSLHARGCEVHVATGTGCDLPELVVNGVTGLLVPPEDVEALTGALIEIGTSQETRRQMGQAGRQRVLEKFSLERMVKELVDYYQLQFNSSKSRGE